MAQTALEYFNGDELCANVWESKYALRDKDGNLLEKTPDDMHWRLANEFARIESSKFKEPYSEQFIFNCFQDFGYIIPQGSPMYGIGNPQLISLSNCYVLDSPTDSYNGIMWTDEQLVQISKRRGGVGLDLSNLRPAGEATNNSSRTTGGIIPFARRYSNSIREVGQDGRRGALMMTLSVHHPEVLAFAACKKDKTQVTGANISIRLTNEFLSAVKAGAAYEQRWPVDSDKPKIKKLVDARTVWMEIIKLAWETAEPGLLFWDNIISESPADCYAKYNFNTVSTNPCGELPLCALDSCRLLLLNAFAFVVNPFTKEAAFDFANFYKYSQIAQRLMDDMIDLELECISRILNKVRNDTQKQEVKQRELDMWLRIYKKCENGRRTGTGLTGLGDAMAAANIKYGSKDSIRFTDYIYSVMKHGCYRSSVDMAKELGPFPIWDAKLEKDNSFLHRLEFEAFEKIDHYSFHAEGRELYADMQKYGRRNISLLTSAPCGSTSLEAGPRPRFGVSSGIEPAFDIKPYIRRKKINLNDKNAKIAFIDKTGDIFEEYTVYHPKLKLWMDVTGETDITKSPWHGCCAEDLDWKQRVKIQAAAQRHIDHSISSTVNLPNDVTPEKVAEIYETAWKSGCKGITVYRKGCRDGILVDKTTIKKTDAPKRPQSLPCDIHHLTVNKEKYTVLVGLFDGEPYEVFAFHSDDRLDRTNKDGTIVKINRKAYQLEYGNPVAVFPLIKQVSGNEEAITRLVSTALRHGTPINFIVHQLEKVNGDLNIFAKSIVRALKKYIKDGTLVKGESCQQCGQDSLRREEGCLICQQCGWSKCS